MLIILTPDIIKNADKINTIPKPELFNDMICIMIVEKKYATLNVSIFNLIKASFKSKK